jgi:hypothetical protein
MNGAQAFAVGIAPQHLPALIAVLLLPVLAMVMRQVRADSGRPPAPVGAVRAWAAWLLGIAAAVHLALPLGHNDTPVLTIAFLASGTAYAWLALRALRGRSWRLLAAPLLIGTLIAYLAVAGSGREEPDQVGIATALVELAALALCLTPTRRGRFARLAGSAATVSLTVIVGATIWIGSFLAHAATDADVSTSADESVAAGVSHTGDHAHEHDHAARAQAGVIMRPGTGHHATTAQQKAAQNLAAATRAAMRRFATLEAALAVGYELPRPGTGTDVHMENKAYKADGRQLDPERPETLVYAIEGGKATLLGVVYVMEHAGVPGPEPGGPITRWHAHNICLTALPPGFGIVNPFGTCPAFSVNITTSEMMHVWIVDNPAGPFAEGLDEAWVRNYHALHGRAYLRR